MLTIRKVRKFNEKIVETGGGGGREISTPSIHVHDLI